MKHFDPFRDNIMYDLKEEADDIDISISKTITRHKEVDYGSR